MNITKVWLFMVCISILVPASSVAETNTRIAFIPGQITDDFYYELAERVFDADNNDDLVSAVVNIVDTPFDSKDSSSTIRVAKIDLRTKDGQWIGSISLKYSIKPKYLS